jgi:hypothetical protein
MEKGKLMTIDVDVLIEKLQDAAAHKGLGAAIAGILIQFIETLPTVDAVPVVRCKDCKYWFKNNGHDKNGCPILDSHIWMGNSGFCSCGERGTDD